MFSHDFHEETVFSFSERAPAPPAERRRDARHLTILRVGALVAPEGRELCLIRNISAGGVMAHVYTRRLPGERVALELKNGQPIVGRVIWAEDSNIGIQFERAVDLAQILSNQAAIEHGWQPRMPRVEVDRMATLRCGARLYGVNTRDISQGGVKVETDQKLEAGRQVVLTMERFRPLPGLLRWYEDGIAGIAFNELIPFHELMGWLRPDAEGVRG